MSARADGPLTQGQVLWTPPAGRSRADSRSAAISTGSKRERGLAFPGYHDLWRWSVTDADGFWSATGSSTRSSDPRSTGGRRHDAMPGRWFAGAQLNYARHLLSDPHQDDKIAVLAYSQTRDNVRSDLRRPARAGREGPRGPSRLGVGRGDRVAAYLPNIPETLVAFLATASIGAIWAACAPEFGPQRPRPVRADRAEGPADDQRLPLRCQARRPRDRSPRSEGLPIAPPRRPRSVRGGATSLPDTVALGRAPRRAGAADFDRCPFDHPLYVLFSSGTTGIPKAIVHGHGGILLST